MLNQDSELTRGAFEVMMLYQVRGGLGFRV